MSDAINKHTHGEHTSGPQDLQPQPAGEHNAHSGSNERDLRGGGERYAPGDSREYGSKNKPEGENYSDMDLRENSPQL